MKKVTIILLFILLLSFSVSKIYSYDIWYHLAAGRYILTEGTVPHRNIFSYTQSDHEWIDIQWLFQVCAYTIYSWVGANGLIILKSLCLLFAFAILFCTGICRKRPVVTAVFFYLAVLCSQERFFARPEMFSLPLFAIYLKILLDNDKRRTQWIYLLPILQVLWVNIQGLFILGIVLVFFNLISRGLKGEFKRPALLLLLCCAACFVNPYTYRGALFPVILFRRVGPFSNVFTATIAEFISPFKVYSPITPTRLLWILLSLKSYTLCAFIALAALTLFTFFLNIRRTNLLLLFSYIAFFCLAVSAKRNLPLFAFVSATAGIYNINSLLDNSPRWQKISLSISRSAIAKSGQMILIILAVVAIFLVVTDSFSIHEKSTRSFGLGILSPTYPVGAIDFIIDNDVRGNVFNTLSVGSYFIWKCYPGRRVFIDGRLEAISDEFYSYYISLLRYPDRWPKCVSKYGITYAILDHWVNPEDALFARIYNDEDWALVYIDGSSAVFLLRNEANNPIIKQHEIDLAQLDVVQLPALLPASPLTSLTDRWVRKKKFPFLEFTLGNLYSAVGITDKAVDYYTKGAEIAPDEAAFYNNIGICYLEEGNMAEAITAFERALTVEPAHLQAMKNLGSAYSSIGDSRNALRYWEMAHQLDPSDITATRSLEKIQQHLLEIQEHPPNPWLLLRIGQQLEEQGKLDQAIEKYQQVLAALPNMPQARYQLGLAYSQKGDLENADHQFREAIRLNPTDSRAYHNLAALYHRRGMTEEAMKHYRSALSIDPESLPTNFNLALLYYEKGKVKKAKKYLKIVLKLNPDFEDAQKLLDKLK